VCDFYRPYKCFAIARCPRNLPLASYHEVRVHLSTVEPLIQCCRVAAVQAEPAWFDLEAGVKKVIQLIRDAASHDAQIIAFPEAFIPGYPMRIWEQGFEPPYLMQLKNASMTVTSDAYYKILDAAKESRIW
jgi:hypothetical protein